MNVSISGLENAAPMNITYMEKTHRRTHCDHGSKVCPVPGTEFHSAPYTLCSNSHNDLER